MPRLMPNFALEAQAGILNASATQEEKISEGTRKQTHRPPAEILNNERLLLNFDH
jgi:hypothetical protein